MAQQMSPVERAAAEQRLAEVGRVRSAELLAAIVTNAALHLLVFALMESVGAFDRLGVWWWVAGLSVMGVLCLLVWVRLALDFERAERQRGGDEEAGHG